MRYVREFIEIIKTKYPELLTNMITNTTILYSSLLNKLLFNIWIKYVPTYPYCLYIKLSQTIKILNQSEKNRREELFRRIYSWGIIPKCTHLADFFWYHNSKFGFRLAMELKFPVSNLDSVLHTRPLLAPYYKMPVSCKLLELKNKYNCFACSKINLLCNEIL